MITSILLLRFEALSTFSNKVKQKVIGILHFNHRTPILGTMNPMQWPPPPTPPRSRAENMQLDFGMFCFLEKGRGGIASALKSYCQCFILKLLMKLDLVMSTFLDINYLLFKIILLKVLAKKVSRHPVRGLACEWLIPEKITPTTEGMLENLTGEGVNSSWNLDCTRSLLLLRKCSKRVQWVHTAALSPWPLRKKWPLGSPVKITFQWFLFLNKEENLLFDYIVQNS